MAEIYNSVPVNIASQRNDNRQKSGNEPVRISNMKQQVKDYNKDTVVISSTPIENKQENRLINNIKNSAKDGVIAGSLVYTGGSLLNGIKNKLSGKSAMEGAKSFLNIPSKALGIAAGVITTGAGLWVSDVKEKYGVIKNKFGVNNKN